MTKQIEDGGPAHPHPVRNEQCEWDVATGMTLRDHFAGQALPFVLAELRRAHLGVGDTTFPQNVAGHCYRVADAMISARKGDA